MDQFAGDIAAMLEIALIGASLVILYYASKENSKLMKAGAYVMFIGGVLGLLCTSYWWFKYHGAGVFNSPINRTVHMMHHDGDENPSHHVFPSE